MKYTYEIPGGPYNTKFRAVRPAKECAAGSSLRYASTSTIRPANNFFPSRRSRTLPSRSRATRRGSLVKEASWQRRQAAEARNSQPSTATASMNVYVRTCLGRDLDSAFGVADSGSMAFAS
mgnify:CR=1 FL=1